MEETRKATLFEVSGAVIQGKKEATALGYPTANIACPNNIPSGIYAGNVIWQGKAYPAALYKEDGKDMIEAHLLDFSKDLYGETLTFQSFHKVRDTKKFTSH